MSLIISLMVFLSGILFWFLGYSVTREDDPLKGWGLLKENLRKSADN